MESGSLSPLLFFTSLQILKKVKRGVQMFCPYCGKENTDNSKHCAECGENLSEEKEYLRLFKIFDLMAFLCMIIVVGSIILYRFKFITLSLSGFLLVFISIILLFMFATKKTRNFIAYFLNLFLFKDSSRKQCPECEEFVPDQDYCINCGYGLSGVLYYSRRNREYVEINREYIRTWERIREAMGTKYGDYHRSSEYNTYYFTKMEETQITECPEVLRFHPCLKFKYADGWHKLILNKEMQQVLDSLIPDMPFTEYKM